MKKKLHIYATLLCLLLLLTAPAQAAGTARSNPAAYIYRQHVVVENRSSQTATNIELKLPAMHPDPFINQFILDTRWSRTPDKLVRNMRGDVTAHFTIPKLAPGARTEIIQEYRVQNYAVSVSLTSPGGTFPAPHANYLQPEDKVESTHPEITAKARELTAGLANNTEKARAIFAFVQQYITYGGANSNKGALSALRTRTGVCEDYAALFVALCRASGIPARIVYGQAANQNNGGFYGHAWAEFFLPTHGWIPVEPTVTSPHVPWQYFGALPAEFVRVPFSLSNDGWQWSWWGGSVAVTSTLSVTRTGSAPLFTDMDGHWASAVAEDLAGRGIISAEQSRFEPSRPLTRAEAARLLVLAQGVQPLYGPSIFRDVKTEDWFHPYIQAAARAGLFAGFDDGTFRPNDRITREQMAAVLSRIKGFQGNAATDQPLTFADTDAIAPWALASVRYSVGIGLFGGDDQNRFRPKDNCSRAEAAALIHRFLMK